MTPGRCKVTTKRIRLYEVSGPGITDAWCADESWDLLADEGSGELIIEYIHSSDCPSFPPTATRWPLAEAKPHVPEKVWDKAMRAKCELQRGEG
jgi:hypothetical protein